MVSEGNEGLSAGLMKTIIVTPKSELKPCFPWFVATPNVIRHNPLDKF